VFQISLTRLAIENLDDGFWFYENQKPGLGNYFRSCLIADIESLTLFAGIHPKIGLHLHKTVSNRFPYAIFYTFNGETASVAAVLDSRQNPARVQQHLSTLQ
jgi:plasmid stabilization system protein ParE